MPKCCAVCVHSRLARPAEDLLPTHRPHLASSPLPHLQRNIRFVNAETAIDTGFCEFPRCCCACVPVLRQP